MNKVILSGNLGQDPEMRTTSNGTAVLNLRLATNERRKAASGEWEDHCEWHTVVMFGERASKLGPMLAKGSKIVIEGCLRTEKYTDKEGRERWSTKVMASDLEFTGPRPDAPRQQPQRRDDSDPFATPPRASRPSSEFE